MKVKRIHIKNGCERMTKTPLKSEILAKALEMWRNDQYRQGCGQLADLTPELSELAESGYISASRSELMRNKYRSEIENKDYLEDIGEFQFDLKLGLEQGTFISGGRGCGKSSLTKTITNRFLKEGYVIRVFDNSQTWRHSSIPNLIILKPYSNFEPNYNESYVFDTSLLSIEQQKTFIENVVDREFNLTASLNENERNWRVYVIEECELVLGTHESSKKIMKLCAIGRNLKMSYIAIAQRFQMVSTNLISLSGQLYIGMMHEQNDLKKIRNWLGDKTKELQNLDIGEFMRYCNGKIAKMNTELFSASTQPKSYVVESKPIQPIPQPKQNNTHAISSLIVAFMWFTAIVLALHGRGL